MTGLGVTLTVVSNVFIPPSPLAVNLYTVGLVGETVLVPLGPPAPTPSIDTSVAFCVSHLRLADSPSVIVLGSASKNVTTGAGLGFAVICGVRLIDSPALTETISEESSYPFKLTC